MFTGRLPDPHGVRGLRGTQLGESMPTVAERLSAAGYATWCSVTGPLLETVGTFRGFEDVEYREAGDRSVHSEFGAGAGAVAQLEGGRAAVLRRPSHLGRPHAAALSGAVRSPPVRPRRLRARDRGLDAWLGTLLSLVAESTVVVLTGDHGENTRLEPHTLRTQELHRRARPSPAGRPSGRSGR